MRRRIAATSLARTASSIVSESVSAPIRLTPKASSNPLEPETIGPLAAIIAMTGPSPEPSRAARK